MVTNRRKKNTETVFPLKQEADNLKRMLLLSTEISISRYTHTVSNIPSFLNCKNAVEKLHRAFAGLDCSAKKSPTG
jgi:hypothetical protein